MHVRHGMSQIFSLDFKASTCVRTVGKCKNSPSQLQFLLLFPKTHEQWSLLVQRRNHLEKHSAGFKPIS